MIVFKEIMPIEIANKIKPKRGYTMYKSILYFKEYGIISEFGEVEVEIIKDSGTL